VSEHAVTVLGATGFTGRKIAARLLEAGLTPQLAGRSEARLRQVAEQLGAELPLRTADTSDLASMKRLGESTRVCLSAAGPYVTMGPNALEGCLHGKAHWLDLAGEPAWIEAAQARDADARQAGITVTPSFAFESAIADFAAAVAREGLDNLESAEVTYFLDAFPSSTGTKRSVIGVLAAPPQDPPPFRIHREAWPWAADAPRARGTLWRVTYPGAECPTVAWQTGAQVQTLFALPGLLGGLLKATLRPAMFALRWGGGALAKPFLGFRRSGPSEAALAKASFTVAVCVRGRRDGEPATRTCFVEGADPYGLTADLVTHAAQAMLAEGYDRTGVRSPSQVVDARSTLEALGLRCVVEDPQEAACPVPS
jgi:short subunit dehydrogenase-like uncharacterized protein